MKVCLKQESKRDLVERVHVNIRSLQRPQGLFFFFNIKNIASIL